MANNFYNITGSPSISSNLTSATIRAEYAAIAAGFDKMPPISANGGFFVRVNAGIIQKIALEAAVNAMALFDDTPFRRANRSATTSTPSNERRLAMPIVAASRPDGRHEDGQTGLAPHVASIDTHM